MEDLCHRADPFAHVAARAQLDCNAMTATSAGSMLAIGQIGEIMKVHPRGAGHESNLLP